MALKFVRVDMERQLSLENEHLTLTCMEKGTKTREKIIGYCRAPTMSKTQVVLETSMGEITLELYWDHAPKTCKNFAELAKRGYYNGVVFHRIIADFMAQSGDPTGTGRGGTSIYGKNFEDEIHPELRFVGAGILAMANAGPNTNGSQFFITLAPTPFLDNKHTIFGRVTAGIRVVQRLGAVATDAQDRPREDVKIHKAKTIEE